MLLKPKVLAIQFTFPDKWEPKKRGFAAVSPGVVSLPGAKIGEIIRSSTLR